MFPTDYQLTLLVLEGSQRGQRVSVSRLPFLIGRGPECHLRPVSPAVGSPHCVLLDHSGVLMLADLGSATGTFVNGVRLEGILAVGDGDELVIGPLRFRLVFKETLPAAEPSVEETAAQALLDGETAPRIPVPTPTPAPSLPPVTTQSKRRVSTAAAAREILSRMMREK